ncbi:hypothetical protein FRC11_003106, partial [Ceratobasidium sp. 423]
CQKPHVTPTLRFRDMSDLLKSAGKVAVDLRGVEIGSSTPMDAVDAEAYEPTTSDQGADDEDTEVQEPSPEEWEGEAGFDRVVE